MNRAITLTAAQWGRVRDVIQAVNPRKFSDLGGGLGDLIVAAESGKSTARKDKFGLDRSDIFYLSEMVEVLWPPEALVYVDEDTLEVTE